LYEAVFQIIHYCIGPSNRVPSGSLTGYRKIFSFRTGQKLGTDKWKKKQGNNQYCVEIPITTAMLSKAEAVSIPFELYCLCLV
jgi:hypothetical protein